MRFEIGFQGGLIIVEAETLATLEKFRPTHFFSAILVFEILFTKHGIHKTNLCQVKTGFIEPIYGTPHPISPFRNSTLFNTYHTN